MQVVMAHVTKTIRGYGADTREYAGNARIDMHAPNPVCRVYASSRGNIKGYQSSHKYSQIRGLDIRRYADIRGHSHRFTVTYPCMDLVTSALPSGPVGPARLRYERFGPSPCASEKLTFVFAPSSPHLTARSMRRGAAPYGNGCEQISGHSHLISLPILSGLLDLRAAFYTTF